MKTLNALGPLEQATEMRRGRLLDLLGKKTNLVVTNSLLKGSKQILDMEAPGGVTNDQTDFILSSDRKIVGNCEVKAKVDNGIVITERSEQA